MEGRRVPIHSEERKVREKERERARNAVAQAVLEESQEVCNGTKREEDALYLRYLVFKMPNDGSEYKIWWPMACERAPRLVREMTESNNSGAINWLYTERELSQFVRFVNDVNCEFPGRGNEDAQPHDNSRGVRNAIFHGTMLKCFFFAEVPLGPKFARFRFSLALGNLKKTPTDMAEAIQWLYEGNDEVEPLRQELVELFSSNEGWDPAYHAIIKQHGDLVSALRRSIVALKEQVRRGWDSNLGVLRAEPRTTIEVDNHFAVTTSPQTQTAEVYDIRANSIGQEQESNFTASSTSDDVLDLGLQINSPITQASQDVQHIAASTQASPQGQPQLRSLDDPKSVPTIVGMHHPAQYSKCPWRACPRPASQASDSMKEEPYQNEHALYHPAPKFGPQSPSLPHPHAPASVPTASDFAPSGLSMTSRQGSPLEQRGRKRKRPWLEGRGK